MKKDLRQDLVENNFEAEFQNISSLKWINFMKEFFKNFESKVRK